MGRGCIAYLSFPLKQHTRKSGEDGASTERRKGPRQIQITETGQGQLKPGRGTSRGSDPQGPTGLWGSANGLSSRMQQKREIINKEKLLCAFLPLLIVLLEFVKCSLVASNNKKNEGLHLTWLLFLPFRFLENAAVSTFPKGSRPPSAGNVESCWSFSADSLGLPGPGGYEAARTVPLPGPGTKRSSRGPGNGGGCTGPQTRQPGAWHGRDRSQPFRGELHSPQ